MSQTNKRTWANWMLIQMRWWQYEWYKCPESFLARWISFSFFFFCTLTIPRFYQLNHTFTNCRPYFIFMVLGLLNRQKHRRIMIPFRFSYNKNLHKMLLCQIVFTVSFSISLSLSAFHFCIFLFSLFLSWFCPQQNIATQT